MKAWAAGNGYDLDLECPPQFHVVKGWSPVRNYEEVMEHLRGGACERSSVDWGHALKRTVGP
jgi:hypothetical protein